MDIEFAPMRNSRSLCKLMKFVRYFRDKDLETNNNLLFIEH